MFLLLFNALISKWYLCIEESCAGVIPRRLFTFYIRWFSVALDYFAGLFVWKRGLICCKAQKWPFLRGANGLLILGERQSDQFLQLSVYYLLPFDPSLSGWSQTHVVVPAQETCLHSSLTCWFYTPRCCIPSHERLLSIEVIYGRKWRIL